MSQDRLDLFVVARDMMQRQWEEKRGPAYKEALKDPKVGPVLREHKVTEAQFGQMAPAVLTFPLACALLDSAIAFEKCQLSPSSAQLAAATPASSPSSSTPKGASSRGQ